MISTLRKIAPVIFCIVLVFAAFGVFGSFIPQSADAVIDIGCSGCGGGGFDWGWGWNWPDVNTHFDGGGGGGCGGGCGVDKTPSCTITASPSGPVAPGSPVTLTWTSLFSQNASIAPGVGAVTPVGGGSVVVYPTANTTYTMTVNHNVWGSGQCQVTVQVTPPNGCILIKKETYNTLGNPITPVAQFTFTLDGGVATTTNDSAGDAMFINVAPGTHTVAEIVPPTWTQLSVTPNNGVVIVPPGPTCAAVVFKNKQVLTPPPTCTLDVSPNTVQSGGLVTLVWTTTNANQISVDEDIDGPMIGISGGSVTAHPTADTTYHFHATGPGGTVTCTDTVTIPQNPPVTINAKKVVCDTEADLPNWGGGGPNVTATTADDYVASHPNCHIEVGWNFQYADGDTGNPGNNVGFAGGDWVTFTDSNLDGLAQAVIDLSTLGDASKIWVREVRTAGFIPFKGIGLDSNSAEMYCHTDVLNYDNFDNINNPQGGQTYNCVAFNAPEPPPPGLGCIDIVKETYNTNGDPLTPVAQFTFKLDNASTTVNDSLGNARFNNVTPGTHTVTEIIPNNTWTMLSVTPVNGVVVVNQGPVCSTVLFKNKQTVNNPPTPACTLTANPTSFTSPGNTTLTWTSSNITNFTIDHGVGSVTPVAGGSTTTPVTTTTTYTGTGTGPYGTVTCTAQVTVTPSTPTPSCTMSISKTSINTGQSVDVSWTSSNVTSGFITPQVGTTTPVASGSMNVFPPSDTTYVGTFTGPYGTTTCQVAVTVHTGGCQGSCGGGYNPPNVVMFKKPGEQPLASVFLSQIPYTGFESGPALTAIFWLAVALFSAVIAYYVVGRGSLRYVFASIAGAAGIPSEEEVRENIVYVEKEEPKAPEIEKQAYVESVAAPAPVIQAAPVFAPATAHVAGSGIPHIADVIESRAHAAGVLMSPEAVEIASSLTRDRAETLKLFGSILNEAVKTIPREDGWVMLTSDRLNELTGGRKPVLEAHAPQEVRAYVEPVSVATVDEAAAVEFVGAVLAHDRTTAFAIVRSLEHDNVSPTALITSAATVLDRLYRARTGGTNGVPQNLLENAASIPDESLHRLVEIFAHALDTVYSNQFTGVKLALAQAFEIVG